MVQATFTCIYCTLVKDKDERSKEHLLQRNLGGDLTEQFVCRTCNSSFSKIDQAIAERSTVALSRVADTPASAHKVKVGGVATYFDEERELFIELEVRNQMMCVVLPQFHLRADGRGELIVTDETAVKQVIDFIAKRLPAGSLESVHRFYGLPDGMPTASVALVVRKPDDGYIRLPGVADETWYFPMLRAAWEQKLKLGMDDVKPVRKEGKFPEVRINLKIAPNDVYRAVAKTAFNVLALKRGSDFVLRPEFDPIRKYIKGDVLLPANTAPDEIAVDGRFVREILPDQQQISFVDDAHAVVFCYFKPELIAFVTLYGSHIFLVRFPLIDYDEPEGLFGHQFSIDRTGNVSVETRDIVRRLLEKHPSHFGLTSEQAAEIIAQLRTRDSSGL